MPNALKGVFVVGLIVLIAWVVGGFTGVLVSLEVFGALAADVYYMNKPDEPTQPPTEPPANGG